MADYIDRDELLKTLKKEFRQNDYIKHNSYFEFKNIVETMPTVDTVEQKHGHWIKISPANIYECSVCNKDVMTSDIEAYQFCHKCGAKMDGEVEDD